MASALKTDGIEYRVILIDSMSRKLLALEVDGALCFVRLSVPPRTRPARRVQLELERVWGLTAVILDFLSVGIGESACVVAELLSTHVPDSFRSVRAEDMTNAELSEPERVHLRNVLEDTVTDPVGRIGWIDDAIGWVEDATGRRVRAKEAIEQYNAGRGFALLRLPMGEGPNYWLKATSAPNVHERKLTCLLSKLCPGCLPSFVAEKPEWNAWVMADEGCVMTTLPTSPYDLARVLGPSVESLAEIQKKTAGMDLPLLETGAFDQRLHTLRASACALFDYIAIAMSHQTSTRVPRIGASRLHEIEKVFDEVCGRMDRLSIPATILHGDMNLGNIIFSGERCCRFIDWCEGYVGQPLMTFQHLLLLNPIDHPDVKESVNDALKGRYRTAMREVIDSEQIDEGLIYMPIVAAASALYGRGDWLQSDSKHDQHRYAYARSIARHMDDAAQNLLSLEAQWT